PETMAHHKGQISLPGGAQDPTDPDPIYTALREAHEELGIEPDFVEVLRTMPPVYARVSGFVITTVIGRLKERSLRCEIVFNPNHNEVAEVIEVPLRELREPDNHHIEQRTADGFTYNIHFYTYGPYEIWGATGRIIHEFLTLHNSELYA
ncbi:MAG: CoA pyrophosphatase, partial [Chloroflexia bacterium]